MSSRMFQSVIMQMKDASDRTLGVIDGEGNVIAATEPSGLGDKWEDAVHRLNATNELVTVTDGKTFKALQSWSARFDYAVYVDGEDELAPSPVQQPPRFQKGGAAPLHPGPAADYRQRAAPKPDAAPSHRRQ